MPVGAEIVPLLIGQGSSLQTANQATRPPPPPTPLRRRVWLVPCDSRSLAAYRGTTAPFVTTPSATELSLLQQESDTRRNGSIMAARIIFRAASFRPCAWPSAPAISLRTFAASPAHSAKALPPRPKPPPDSEIEEYYIKGSGPGGQKINKTNSAVQLKHIPTGIVVKSQATRSRDQNRKHARELLAQRIDDLRNGDQSRSAIVGAVKQKKAASATKKSRRKYKKLEEEKLAAETSVPPNDDGIKPDAEAQNDSAATAKKVTEIMIQRI